MQLNPEIKIGDILKMRKTHPCGSDTFSVYRMGADIGIACTKCGRRVMLERRKLARRMKSIVPPEDENE